MYATVSSSAYNELHMELTYVIVAFIQSIGVSLGVGSSTIAVANYISAVRDGNFDESERRMMRVVYTMLRISMVTILATLFIHGVMLIYAYGELYFRPFVMLVWLVTAVLFLNAYLMTKHLMPMTLGPGIQAGSWYSLAVLYFFSAIGLTGFTFVQLISGYAGMLVLAIVLINGALAYFKSRVA